MRRKGKIRSWNDERGFGFIEADGGSKDVFLHISALKNRSQRPVVGQLVSYTVTVDAQGRPRSSKVAIQGGVTGSIIKTDPKFVSLLVACIFLCAVATLTFTHVIQGLLLWAYLGISVITFVVYAYDKSAAKGGNWRTKEATLHWLSLLGGWPGALVAQQTLRHKSKKQSFRVVFWVTVVLNCAALIWLCTPDGAAALNTWLYS